LDTLAPTPAKNKCILTSEFVVSGVHQVFVRIFLRWPEVSKDPNEVVEVDHVVAAVGLHHDATLVLHQLNHVPEELKRFKDVI
jgi:hypothetical protein